MVFWIDALGYFGAALVLLAYALLSAQKMDADSAAYQWMNIIGAACFIANSGYHGAYPSVVTNVIWSGIGIAALVRIAKIRKSKS